MDETRLQTFTDGVHGETKPILLGQMGIWPCPGLEVCCADPPREGAEGRLCLERVALPEHREYEIMER